MLKLKFNLISNFKNYRTWIITDKTDSHSSYKTQELTTKLLDLDIIISHQGQLWWEMITFWWTVIKIDSTTIWVKWIVLTQTTTLTIETEQILWCPTINILDKVTRTTIKIIMIEEIRRCRLLGITIKVTTIITKEIKIKVEWIISITRTTKDSTPTRIIKTMATKIISLSMEI